MSNEKNTAELVADLEQRIDTMQDMGDADLGTFSRFDWVVLIIISIVIPVIVVEFTR